MGREDEIIGERMRKIEELRKKGINPYPYSFDKKNNSDELHEKYEKLANDKKTKDSVKIAGRVMIVRNIGNLIFADLRDSQGKIQLQLQTDETDEKIMEFFKSYIDAGDFVGVEGTIMRTKRGELTVLVKKLELLSKAILPLPEKWHGLQDKEERYRKRYLDLLNSQEVKDVFVKREQITAAIREFFKGRGFLEVETPYLQPVYGGAEARPFTTHLNSLDINLYLAISPELYLKRLIVGGYERVFAMARNFRNEGIDKWHNPEFTMLEAYQAYADYNDMMELFESACEFAVKKVYGKTEVVCQGKKVDFKKPWKRMTMAEAIKKFAEIDVNNLSEKELLKFCDKEGVEYKEKSWGMLVQAIFETYCEKELIQPTFITDHPRETSPLCKIHRKDKRLIERFEPFCLGAELGNAYSELNDPVMQKQLFKEQQERIKTGNAEAHPADTDFVEALEQGMPPTGGLGMGIDRFIIMVTGSESIRDIILFPFMKPAAD